MSRAKAPRPPGSKPERRVRKSKWLRFSGTPSRARIPSGPSGLVFVSAGRLVGSVSAPLRLLRAPPPSPTNTNRIYPESARSSLGPESERGYDSHVSTETWELLSYIVTVIGLPMAIFVFVYEKTRERNAAEQEMYQTLSDNYQEFLNTALANPDLKLFSHEPTPDLTDEQRERGLIILNMVVSLFERAYLILYDENLSADQKRRWSSWEDYMLEWCQRDDFRLHLPDLLAGEDADFAGYISGLADRAATSPTLGEVDTPV